VSENRGAIALRVIPRQSELRDLGLVMGGAAITALAAQVSLPWQPVPFTLQTLSVTLCGLALGARLGVASQIAYLGAGLAGLPVFAEGKFGPTVFMGPTGGYLASFVLAAGVLGLLADRGWTRSIWGMAVALLLGNALILLVGAWWLAQTVGMAAAWTGGVLPFISGAVVKSVGVVWMLPFAWRFVKDDPTAL